MAPHRVLAAAQTVPVRGDVAANLARHLGLAHAAADRQARVVVFPELSLTGYELDLAERLAFRGDDPRLEPLIDVASSRRVTLVAGAPVRLASGLHIGAFVVSPDGTVDVYTKQRLGAFPPEARVDGIVPPAEATVFAAGDRDPPVRFDGNVAAVAVCADTGRPSHPRAAAARGATTYLASMFVIPSELEREVATLRTYAERHALAVVFANFGGPSGGLAAAGRSAIWSPAGSPVARCDADGEGLVVAIERPGGWQGETVGGHGATLP